MTIPSDQAETIPEKQPIKGFVFMMVSISCFAVMDALVKWFGATYPVHQIMFFRCTVAFIMISVLVVRFGGMSLLATNHIGLHVLRSILGLLAMVCAFYGFTVMPLADASAIFYTAPLLATAFSVPILGERVGIHRWSCIVIGMLGALVIIRPGGDVLSHGGFFMLIASLLVALTSNIVRKLNRVSAALCITFYFALSGTLASIIACFVLGWASPHGEDLVGLIAIGLLGGAAQFTLTLSLRVGEVGLISPLKYMAIVIGAIIGYLVWSEVPDTMTFIGMTMIILAGVYSVFRETRSGANKAV